ncbi:histidine phosphatase family protein [Acetanaerobacterium elongatum]|uniref:Uncharacterized protein n=1 Tax=Acetanaerobacterium elongatum TaxID=258515 RepID=A0A1G9V0T6_9FIRM|nr:histidine phosphatase family protein [Acetanaerobacterium elongatum]SDM65881.1 hypothetical protein SAMN05192585_10320 [Acetanaerobacterium elongatum]
MITYRLHLICPAETPEATTQLAEAAEEGLYPHPAKVYFAPLKSCEQTAEILYPNLLAQRADFLLPFSQPKEGAVYAVKAMLQEMMSIGFAEAAVVADSGVLMQILTACALPERPEEEWRLQPGRGYTLLTDAALWMRCEKLELYDTVLSSAVSEYADDEAYLDYAESLLDEGTVEG